MQKPTSEPDYTINLEAIKAIIEAAGNGPFIHHLTHRPGGITHAIFDADGYKCADRLSEHFVSAVIAALNFGPGIIDRLIDLEELLLKLLAAHKKVNLDFDPLTGPNQWDAATIADGMDDYESAEKMLLELAERIKAERAAQA